MAAFSFALWVILNGRITLEICIFGAAASAAVFAAMRALFGYSLKKEINIYRNALVMLWYAAALVVEIVKAALAVAGVAVRGEKPDPVLVSFESPLEGTVPNVLLANAITLTPGTITASLAGNRFEVHCLKKDYAEGLDSSVFVKILSKWK